MVVFSTVFSLRRGTQLKLASNDIAFIEFPTSRPYDWLRFNRPITTLYIPSYHAAVKPFGLVRLDWAVGCGGGRDRNSRQQTEAQDP